MSSANAVQTILVRELLTVARSRVYVGLLVGVTLVSFGMLAAGGGPEVGYVPTAIDLLLPFELLVPAVAIALGYRVITDDVDRGELDVLGTYPIPAWAYVLGVYLGRAIALLVAIGLPLALVALYLSTLSQPSPASIATHRGIDSPLLFGRFVFLSGLYGLTVLAIVLALSALASSRRAALGLGILLFGLVVVGVDLLLLRGFGTEWIASHQLTNALAVSPASAYRGLVFETVLHVAFDAETGYASPVASAAGLVGWLVLSLGATTAAVRRHSR